MAQSATLKNKVIKRKPAKKKSSFADKVPQSAQAFVARRLWDLSAAFITLCGLFVMIAIATYHSGDASWNTAQDAGQSLQNWGGAPGAYVADFAMQTVGISAFLFAFICVIWGWKLFKRETIALFIPRVLGLLALPLIVAMAFVPFHGVSPLEPVMLSGALGAVFYAGLENMIPFEMSDSRILGGVLGLIGISIFIAVSAIHPKSIAKGILNAVKALHFSLQVLWGVALAFKNWVMRYNNPDFDAPPIVAFDVLKDKIAALKEARATAFTSAPQRVAPDPAPSHDVSAPVAERVTPPLTAEVVTPKKAAAKQAKAQAKTTKKETQTSFTLADPESWDFPSLSLLEDPPEASVTGQLDEKALQRNAELLQNVLSDFSVNGDVTSIYPGPVVTLYELEPAPGTKTARVIGLSDDIARSMSAISVRCAVVPGRNVIGIELPNKNRQVVYMHDMLASKDYAQSKAGLPLILGKDIGGQPIIADLAKMPHLLVAGTTGSGKSVAVNTMILSLLYSLSPEQCRFIMIDPKMLELSVYDDIPHLLAPVVTEPGKAVVSLKWAVAEMENRYKSMSKLGVRNIDGYNARLEEARKKGETIMTKVQTGFDAETGQPEFEDREMDLTPLPYIVIIVDEFADLMLVAGKDVENAIQRLAQMARAAGIHLIMATQRPSVDVITGVIKANFPTRISFQVTSKIDSRTILGEGGAEQLLGMGDMLYMAPGGRVTRVHGPFVSDSDVEQVVGHLKMQRSPSYINDVTEGGEFGDSEVMNAMFGEGGSESSNSVDELYDTAVSLVAREGKASTSFVQRHLQIGYNRAARIVEEMERQGVISPANSTGKRTVMVQDHGGGT